MPSDLLSHSSSSPAASSLVVIDPTVEDAAFLANSVSGTDVVVLDANQDGIEQITALLANYEQLSSLHIVSHGAVGQLQLGSTVLGLDTLPHYAEQLTQWQDKLSEEADILLYGCDVADGIVGRSFVGQLGQLTGADIAASNDLTGNAALGGDWDLEWTTGDIETNLAFDANIQNTYQSVYSTSGGLDALLLIGTSSTELEDYTEIRYRLESLGFSVVQKLASSLQLSDTTGMELVVSAAFGGISILDNLDLPLIVFNDSVAKQLDMGIWSTSALGVGGRTLTIESTEPLLTAGLSGVVNIYDPSGGLTYLEPTSSAIRVGTLAERPYTTPANATPIFAYEEGAALYNGEFALARQVSFLGYTRWVSDLSNQGWQLFDAAVQWAIGEPSAPVEISLALSNDTGVSDSDGLTADPTLAGQLSTANNITSLQARIGNGQFVSVLDALQSDGTFTLDLEQLSHLNGGGLAYGNYTVEVQAQTAGGSTDTELIDFSYEFQQSVLPYSNGAFVPLELAAGQTTFQFGLPNDIANGDQLLVYLLNENDPTDTLLANGAEGNPLLSGTNTYLSYDPSIVSVNTETVTVDVSSLTSAELDSAMVYFVVFSEFDSPSDDPDYYSYDGYGWGSGFGWGGGGGGGGITDIQFSSPGWATTGDGSSDPDDPGSGGSGSAPDPEPPTRQFLTQLGGDGYFISYDLLDEDDTFTKPTEIKFGNNVLTLNYSDTGAFIGSSNDELLDVVLASVGLTSLDILAAGEIQSSEAKSFLPSAQTLQLWDVWSRIGEIAIKPNKDFDVFAQEEQTKLFDFQEDLLKKAKVIDKFQGYKENQEQLQAIVKLGNVYAALDPQIFDTVNDKQLQDELVAGIFLRTDVTPEEAREELLSFLNTVDRNDFFTSFSGEILRYALEQGVNQDNLIAVHPRRPTGLPTRNAPTLVFTSDSELSQAVLDSDQFQNEIKTRIGSVLEEYSQILSDGESVVVPISGEDVPLNYRDGREKLQTPRLSVSLGFANYDFTADIMIERRGQTLVFEARFIGLGDDFYDFNDPGTDNLLDPFNRLARVAYIAQEGHTLAVFEINFVLQTTITGGYPIPFSPPGDL
ncbi:MAG: DUF4347 domain-containing protein [Thainema sp.]